MTRRDLLKLMLASAAAEAVDFERLLWVPKPIVTVPEMPYVMGILRRETKWIDMSWVIGIEQRHGMTFDWHDIAPIPASIFNKVGY